MGGEGRSRAARREALLRESRTGCHRRQPWAISEATTPRQDVRSTLHPEAKLCLTRSTASWGTSCTPPFGRPLRGRAPPLLLRCRESRTGCHRRQPWAISEATTPRQDVRNTVPFEAMHSATRSTASWGTSCTPPFGRPLRGRAPPLLLRCRESRTGCHRRQPWAISEATTPRQDVRNTLRPEATHSAKRSEPPQGYIRTGCTSGACAGNSA